MKENKKAILEILKKKSSKKEGKKDDKFESLVLNLAFRRLTVMTSTIMERLFILQTRSASSIA